MLGSNDTTMDLFRHLDHVQITLREAGTVHHSPRDGCSK